MHQLDDASFVTRLDPKGMYALTCDFPNQCRRALEIARSVDLRNEDYRPTFVMLTGLGGSAAGGDFAKALFDEHGAVPFSVNRDYHLPKWVGPETLVFCASYSGNTEETLSAYAGAKAAGAMVIAVTSGGKLAEMARADGYPVVTIPGGQPPRTALGFMMVPIIVVSERLGLIPPQDYNHVFAGLDDCVTSWGLDAPYHYNIAKKLAETLHGKLSVIYGLGGWQAIVANRWKGQINENAKNMTFANAFPELNHNEILGWVKAYGQGVARWVALILEDGSESEKMKARARVTTDLIRGVCEVHNVEIHGETLLAKMMNLTLLGDYVSLYLAALNEVDPENIDSINVLKQELAQIA